MSLLLSIDPGVNEAGVAIWDSRYWKKIEIHLPCDAFVVKADTNLQWWERVRQLIVQIEQRVVGQLVMDVYCEMPVLFAGAGGHAAARRGDLTHLAFAVGAIAEWTYNRGAEFLPIDVNQWIGQLPKDVMHARVERMLLRHNNEVSVHRLLGKPSHHYDAIGVGLYAQEHWK